MLVGGEPPTTLASGAYPSKERLNECVCTTIPPNRGMFYARYFPNRIFINELCTLRACSPSVLPLLGEANTVEVEPQGRGAFNLDGASGRIIEARGTLGLFFRCSESANSWNQVSILGNDFTEAHSRSQALAAPVDAVRNSDCQRSLTVSGSRTICGHGPDLPRFWIIQGCGGKPASISCP